MSAFNKVILMGNLTRDPETRFTPSGTAVADVGLAVNRAWTDGQGQKKEEVTFLNLVAFGRQAENIAKYMRKGSSILVEGRLKTESWEDKATGNRRSRVIIIIERSVFTGSKSVQREDDPESVLGKHEEQDIRRSAKDPTDDDVPF